MCQWHNHFWQWHASVCLSCGLLYCIYLQPFTSYRLTRYWSEITTFFYPLAFNAPVGCRNSGKIFGFHKTRLMGLPGSEDSLTIGWAVLTQYQRVTDSRTDGRTGGRTDIQPIAITCVSLLTRALTRRMAIANVTCVSFCNQPNAHYLATSRESRQYVVAFSRSAGAGIWLRQESLRHILASPGYVPGTIAVSVTWMKRGCNACQTHRSM